MDMILVIVLLVLAAAPLALLAGWFVDKGYGGLGSFVGRGDRDAWWRATMPWPQGVQEEDGVRWHIRGPDAPDGPMARSPVTPVTREVVADDFEIAPVRPRARVSLRPPPASRGSRR